MKRPWSPSLLAFLYFWVAGCAHMNRQPEPDRIDEPVVRAAFQAAEAVTPQPGMAAALDSDPNPPELSGPQPLDAYIRRALAENRTVQAAVHNVRSLKYRIPQVTALDDPVASNTIFPIPSVAPQYSLMGYNPYNLTLAQQFPWFGTRRLRGEVADRDVRVALAELAAAQLDAVAAVRRAYFDLHAAERTAAILAENRTILEDFRAIARSRLAAGGSQQDVIRAETLISELDRTRAGNEQSVATARAALSRQVHSSPDADLRTMPELPMATVPAEIERLYQLAITARPELRGRLDAIARDEKVVELARKRFYPKVTLGLAFMDMTKTDAVTPRTASGSPNVGLFIAFNLPVYRDKYRAGVCEAQERAIADAKLYEAERDGARSEIQDLLTQARVQKNVLDLLRDSILPRARDTLELAKSDYRASNVDIATVLSAQREILQVEIQVVQVESELAKALASLERAVGCQVNERTLEPEAAGPAPPPLPSSSGSPFRPTRPPPSPGAGRDTLPEPR
jgi:outer membrane protein, heavy metal efflux system